jgi:hypothetical protein
MYRLKPQMEELIRAWLEILDEARVDYAVGGAYAFHAHTGIWRATKDFDVFIAPEHVKTALDALRGAYFNADIRDPSWLAKAETSDYLLDLIFGFRHRQIRIDREWFEHSLPVELMGIETRILSIEQMIVSKAFIGFRERFDGADIAHLIRESKGKLDWDLMLAWLGSDSEILLWHLVFFRFVYPGHAEYVPNDLLRRLLGRLEASATPENTRSFRGLLVDATAFLVDSVDFGYEGYPRGRPLVDRKGKPIR